jgi:uncharacterized membrane protein
MGEIGVVSEEETEDEGIAVSSRLLAFLILGIALVLIGTVVLVLVSFVLSSSASGAVIIFIGPFPIVFGAGPNATWLIIIGIILAVLSVIAFLVMKRRYS